MDHRACASTCWHHQCLTIPPRLSGIFHVFSVPGCRATALADHLQSVVTHYNQYWMIVLDAIDVATLGWTIPLNSTTSYFLGTKSGAMYQHPVSAHFGAPTWTLIRLVCVCRPASIVLFPTYLRAAVADTRLSNACEDQLVMYVPHFPPSDQYRRSGLPFILALKLLHTATPPARVASGTEDQEHHVNKIRDSGD